MENSDEQNRLMWKYTYIDMLIGKRKIKDNKKLGNPNKVINDGRIEIFQISSNLQIQLVYLDAICIDVL